MGEDIWYQAVDHGYKHDAFVACSVLNLFTKDGKIKEAKAVFEGIKRSLKLQEHGLQGDGIVMLGLIQSNYPRLRIKVLEAMIDFILDVAHHHTTSTTPNRQCKQK
ncbi:unnamed protein product [Amaranthus hypochondriacus]